MWLTTPFVIRAMGAADLDRVVQIHLVAFPGFFLTLMGPRFLRAYYTAVLDFPHHIALVAEADTPPSLATGFAGGFAVGFTDAPGFYAFFSRRRRRLLPLMALAVLRRPSLGMAILRNTRRVAAETRAGDATAVELSSIATSGPGGGVGSALLAAFVTAAVQAGGRSIVLTTDADGNAAVRRFYERRGFVLEGRETRGARALCCYRRDLA